MLTPTAWWIAVAPVDLRRGMARSFGQRWGMDTRWIGGIAVDASGNVYVSDCVHSRLLKVSNGNATTMPASGSG